MDTALLHNTISTAAADISRDLRPLMDTTMVTDKDTATAALMATTSITQILTLNTVLHNHNKVV